MAEAKITILIPTYQRPALLEKALNSALNQTMSSEKYSILVVDNDPNSGTETEMVVERLRCANLRYIKNEKNLGGYGNWNRGFQLATTEWVCLLHDDDLLLPNCLSRALELLSKLDSPRLGAIIPWQCNLYDNPAEERLELQEKSRNWKARLDNWAQQKTAGRLWKVGLFDNYIICSAYPALSGGNVIRRSAVLQLGGFGEKWPCEDIFMMNRMAEHYDCYLVGEQWGWYRFGTNNMWSKPDELQKWDLAKKTFRDAAAAHSRICALYHKLFGQAMCVFDQNESVRFAKQRGTNLRISGYAWVNSESVSRTMLRLCRWNRNTWHVWMSIRAALFGRRVR